MNTVSLDLAKKLHASGYRGETEKTYFHDVNEGEHDLVPTGNISTFGTERKGKKQTHFSAPNATELLRDLPEYTYLTKLKKGFQVIYEDQDSPTDFKEHADTPSEALGLLMLSLHEKGII